MTASTEIAESTPDSGAKANGRARTAIVYQILHHFRDPIFSRLVNRGEEAPAYRFYAAKQNDVDSNRTIDPARAGRSVEEGGLPWTFIRNRRLPGPFLWQSGVIRAALRRDFETIVFLGNMYFLSTWVAAGLARLSGKRVLFWGHGYTRPEANLKGRLRQLFYRLGHGALLYGNRARDFLLARGFASQDLYVVYNSLDYARQKSVREATPPEQIAALRESLFDDPDLPILVCIGRLDPRKRLDQLIDIVCELDTRGLPVNVLIVGDGEARENLEARAKEKQVQKRVNLYGACFDEDEIGPIMMSSALCVCPGHVGLTAVHAMAYGVPVISHDDLNEQAPEVEAILPGETGDLFCRGSVEDLTDRIENWLRTRTDRAAVASECIRVIEDRYNAERQAFVIDAAVRGIPADSIELPSKRSSS